MSDQQKNQPRQNDLKGANVPSARQTPPGGIAEMRPSPASGRRRPYGQDLQPAHPPGTVGHTIPRNEISEQMDGESGEIYEGEMGGSSRAVRITNPNNKNRAA